MNNIILIGFMGSGKTTFGRWLSEHKEMKLLDTDQCIEQRQNRSINDIFAEDGEDAFRTMETELIKELIKTTNHTVISVGGGLPVKRENRHLLKQLGKVIYLEASEKELVKRLSGDTSRPLLVGTDLKARIHQLMKDRKAIYIDTADMILSTEKKTFDQMYLEITKRFEEM